MRNFLLSLVCLLLPMAVWAQFENEKPWLKQGQMQVGLGLGAGWADAMGANVRLTPYAQYFLKDNWALRIEGRLILNGVETDQYAGAGLLTQYHFVRTGRLSVYGQVGYFYGQTSQGFSRIAREYPANATRYEPNTVRQAHGMINVGFGAQYQFSRRWFANALAEKNINKITKQFPRDGYNLSLGVGFRIK